MKMKGGKNSAPAISTASLPDVVFMVLFFFMVTTVMREHLLDIEIKTPDASAITQLENKSLVEYIYIGKPLDEKKYGDNYRVQINGQLLKSATEVKPMVKMLVDQHPQEDQPYLTFSLKVDEEADMGIVTRVKHELREADALKINYSTHRKKER